MTEPIPPSIRYKVSDTRAYSTGCPVCGAKPRRDCRSHLGARKYKGGREMHAGRYQAAAGEQTNG